MKKSTKGAIAAAAAGVLLLGGAGSLAYWTADADVDAGDLEAGSITLTAIACDSDSFLYEDGTEVDLIVPGDVVTKDCDVTLDLEGDNIGATLQIDKASIAAATEALAADEALAGELEAGVEIQNAAGDVIPGVSVPGTSTVTAQITVTFPYGTVSAPDPRTDASNGSQNGVAALNTLELIAVQTNTRN